MRPGYAMARALVPTGRAAEHAVAWCRAPRCAVFRRWCYVGGALGDDPRDGVRGISARVARPCRRPRSGPGEERRDRGRVANIASENTTRPSLPHRQSSAFSAALRQNLSLHASVDNGRTWTPAASIYPGSAAYSTLASDGAGAVALAFERDNYGHISFAGGLQVAGPI